tara:strand:+ start:889 stop:2040 length:1152 start_codon:yes stop_codon:yes gene_type:complete
MNLFEFLNILIDKKILFIKNIFITCVISITVSLMLPKTFASYAILMPPSKQSDLGILSIMNSDNEFSPLGGMMSGKDEEALRFIAILKSRIVMEKIINKFDLISYYKSNNIEEALETLSSQVNFEIEEEGTLSIVVYVSTNWFHTEISEMKARQLSNLIAREFINQLDVINKKLQIEQASHQRKFLGERYSQSLIELVASEHELKNFKEQFNIISFDNQTKAAIESAASLKNQILTNEIKIGIASSKLDSNHPDVKSIQIELNELKEKLYEIEYGSKKSMINSDKLFPVLSEMPKLDAELMRLLREIEVKSSLFLYLTQQYEDAKIQEARNTPTIQVLDYPTIPIKKTAPQRLLIVVVMLLIAFLGTCSYIVIIENNKNIPIK